uniref:Uncharacterized protein n=1 Tax=Mola mola TaxID=94237 RepID=A0A3Q3XQK3_MOLML
MTILVSTLIHSKAEVKCLCVLMFLSFPLTMTEVPGPCRHSITREHLLTVRHLMDNQLRSGCSITYTFIEQRSLSKCCFVKAALPWILELLTTHFKYSRGSVNDGYVQSLRALILNIYSQKCVPQINEEVEDKPESFEMLYRGSPLEALKRASEVLSIYWELVTMSNAPVDWRCQHEYSDFFSSTTEQSTEQSTDSSTHHSAGGRSLLSRKLCDQLHSSLDPLGSYIIAIINILQKVMVENQQRPHTERQSETCTRSALSFRDLQDIEMEAQ